MCIRHNKSIKRRLAKSQERLVKHTQDPNLPHWSAYLRTLRKQSTPAAAPQVEDEITAEPAKEMAAGPAEEITVAPAATVAAARPSLGRWNFYFIAKLILFGMGLISFHPLANIAFAGLLLLSSTLKPWRVIRNLLATAIGISLLYYDSWLPPIERLFSQASLISSFSPGYFIELISRFINLSVVGLLILAWLGYWLVSRWIRIGGLVVASMAVLVFTPYLSANSIADTAKPDMDKVVHDFFAQEAQRSVILTAPPKNVAPFDIIFIHVCSLSWDDVLAVGLEKHPLWQHFDIRLTKFNSATAYSGPSAIHLLRATCGQQEHKLMYGPVPEKCYLMNSLLRAGFEPNLALNHDGKFGDFLGELRTYGRLSAQPLPLDGINVTQHAFDGSPIYDDISVLDRWLETRQQSRVPRAALYYNTISLHDGNKSVNQPDMSSMQSYKPRLSRLLDNMEKFMQDIEKSGRRAIVIMVPEHGAALRGDKKQIAGLREIPTPAITTVPVGIKIIGDDEHRTGKPVSVDKPTSYLAISHIIERMLQNPPFGHAYSVSDYLTDLPVTQFVAQNQDTTVAEYKHRYYVKHGTADWE